MQNSENELNQQEDPPLQRDDGPPWERLLFNILILTLLWFLCHNGSRLATEFYDSHLKLKLVDCDSFPVGRSKLF